MKNILSVVYVALLVGAVFLLINDQGEDMVDTEDLTFSTTQSWDADLYGMVGQGHTLLTPEEINSITIPEPPANNSTTTKEELELLHEYVSLRNTETQTAIESELDVTNITLGNASLKEVIDTAMYPHTATLLSKSLAEFTVLVISEKNKFDRVRPSVLDETLTTTIEIPGHPAYPSGHASQSRLLALILADIHPENTENYIADANQVAKNREIAGVHYPSDSSAGQSLAEQYFAILKQKDWYQAQYAKAIEEWE